MVYPPTGSRLKTLEWAPRLPTLRTFTLYNDLHKNNRVTVYLCQVIPVSLRESISFSRLDRVLCNRPYSRPLLISLFRASVIRCSRLDIRSSHLSPEAARFDCDNRIKQAMLTYSGLWWINRKPILNFKEVQFPVSIFFLFISALSNDMVRNPIIDFPQFCMRLELCWFHVWDFWQKAKVDNLF